MGCVIGVHNWGPTCMGGNCVSSCTLKTCDFFLCKKSFVGHNLNVLMLQVKLKNGPGKFFHKCTYTWFRITGMWCGIDVHKLGPNL